MSIQSDRKDQRHGRGTGMIDPLWPGRPTGSS
jgi:hypothetical protein